VPQVPTVRGDQVVKALEKVGFLVVRVRGSHHVLRHADGRGTSRAGRLGLLLSTNCRQQLVNRPSVELWWARQGYDERGERGHPETHRVDHREDEAGRDTARSSVWVSRPAARPAQAGAGQSRLYGAMSRVAVIPVVSSSALELGPGPSQAAITVRLAPASCPIHHRGPEEPNRRLNRRGTARPHHERRVTSRTPVRSMASDDQRSAGVTHGSIPELPDGPSAA
jgi:hypothetical protein